MANFKSSAYEIIHHTNIPKMKFSLTDASYCSAHIHADMEIFFLIEGQLQVTTQTETFSLISGEMAVFNPYQVHSYISVSEVSVMLVLQIDTTFCKPYYPQLTNTRFETSNISKIIPPKYFDALSDICYDIGYNYFSEILAYELRCIGDINRLLVILLTFVPFQVLTDQELASATRAQQRMERIMTYINNHFQEKISLADIAQKEDLSIAYLSRFFKAQIGQSFQSYINALRLEHAIFLLTNTNKTILDISIESGFSDLKYMTKAFSEKFNMTAGEYRRLHQGNSLISGISVLGENDTNVTFSNSETNDAVVKVSNSEATDSAPSFTKAESLFIMRKFHHFDCDDDDSPNRIYDIQ